MTESQERIKRMEAIEKTEGWMEGRMEGKKEAKE